MTQLAAQTVTGFPQEVTTGDCAYPIHLPGIPEDVIIIKPGSGPMLGVRLDSADMVQPALGVVGDEVVADLHLTRKPLEPADDVRNCAGLLRRVTFVQALPNILLSIGMVSPADSFEIALRQLPRRAGQPER